MSQSYPIALLGSGALFTARASRLSKVFKDVAFGNTKVFVRTPRTLTLLEQERAARIPQVVLIMQRVRMMCDLVIT